MEGGRGEMGRGEVSVGVGRDRLKVEGGRGEMAGGGLSVGVRGEHFEVEGGWGAVRGRGVGVEMGRYRLVVTIHFSTVTEDESGLHVTAGEVARLLILRTILPAPGRSGGGTGSFFSSCWSPFEVDGIAALAVELAMDGLVLDIWASSTFV